MRLCFTILLLLCVLAIATLRVPSAAHASTTMIVWTQSVANKVQPTTAVGSGNSITLEGARGSYEQFQIIVHANGGALSGINATASNLSDGLGHTIPSTNITFFREYFIDFTGNATLGGSLPVPANSPTGDGRIPDPLIPFIDSYSGLAAGAPFTVTANLNQPIWMDVFIPANTIAGNYSGNVTVTAAGQPSIILPMSLTVWNLLLPDMRIVTTYFQMSMDNFINYHSGIYSCSNGNCWLNWSSPLAHTIVKRYEELAHAHRIDIGENFIPDPSNGCSPPSNWSAYDAALAPYMNGMYWSDGVPGGRMDPPFSPGVTWGIEQNCTQAQYTALAAAWATHLKSQGWFSRAIVYAEDEPPTTDYPRIAMQSQWMQNGDPDWKPQIMDTTTARVSDVATLNPALGIYTQALAWYANWYHTTSDEYGRAEWQNQFAQNIRLWFYESNAQGAPYPTYATNTLLGMEPRMMKWGTWYESASGFLMWSINTWDNTNPWGPNTTYGKTGDGVLIYPGNHNGTIAPIGSPTEITIDGPIPSYRLKMIRAGLQDWALFKLAEQYGLSNYARSQVAQAYGQLGGCTWSGCVPVNGQFFWKSDDTLMMQIRHNIALAILAAQANMTNHAYLPLVKR